MGSVEMLIKDLDKLFAMLDPNAVLPGGGSGGVGIDNLNDLFELQIADIKGSNHEFQDFSNVAELKGECFNILNEKVPLSKKDLCVNGRDLIDLGIGFKQGKKLGDCLDWLLECVIEDSSLNCKDSLENLSREWIESR
jgi:tRNA nucleotidyltransferase (CCA-adding enzyme)